MAVLSEFLDPGPELDLRAPPTAVLAKDVKVGFRNLIRQQHAVVTAFGHPGVVVALAYGAVDDEMGNVNALRMQLAREALGEAAQREFSHREGRGVRVALDARRS